MFLAFPAKQLKAFFKFSALMLILAAALASPVQAQEPQSYGPVTPKETLGEIAQYLRGTYPIPLKYVVQAIYEANPESFSEGGIGTLHVGSVLIIPDMQELLETVPERLSKAPIAPTVKPSDIPRPVSPIRVNKPTPIVAARTRFKTPKNNDLQILIDKQGLQIEQLTENNEANAIAIEDISNPLAVQKQDIERLQAEIGSLKQSSLQMSQHITNLEQQLTKLKQQDSQSAPALPQTDKLQTWLPIAALTLAFLALILSLRKSKVIEVTNQDKPERADKPASSASFVIPRIKKAPPKKPVIPSQVTSPNIVTDEQEIEVTDQQQSEHTDESGKEDIIEPPSLSEPTTEPSAVSEIGQDDLIDELETTHPLETLTDKLESEPQTSAAETPQTKPSGFVEVKDIEDKLSHIYLHIDMGDIASATQTMGEIDIENNPQYVDKVNEAQLLIDNIDMSLVSTGYTEHNAGLKTVSYDSLDEEPFEATQLISTLEPDESEEQTESLDNAIEEQLKQLDTDIELGKLPGAKQQVAAILLHDSPHYRDEAIARLKKIESQIQDNLSKLQSDNSSEDELAGEKTQKIDTLREYEGIIPNVLSSYFELYSKNENGFKLALAYLSLDIDDVDVAKDFFRAVINGDDATLATEASLALKKL